jgi:TolA-binding protein
MKRFFISSLTILLSTLAMAATAQAGQVSLEHSAADLNGDGEVSITELKQYNRDQRDA